MQLCGTKDVSFIFSCKVTGKEIPPDLPILGGAAEAATAAPAATGKANVEPAKVLTERNSNVPVDREVSKKKMAAAAERVDDSDEMFISSSVPDSVSAGESSFESSDDDL